MKHFKNFFWLAPLVVIFVVGCTGDGKGTYVGPPADSGEPIVGPTITPPVDTDADGIPDEEDNCPTVANADQVMPVDTDGDGVGDACVEPTASPAAAPHWSKVSTGQVHACAIAKDGSLWCWGSKNSGRLGNGETTGYSAKPVQVGTETGWKEVSAGEHHTCAIKIDGPLFCWGYNDMGQLGTGDFAPKSVPTKIVGADSDKWISVSAGGGFTCAIKEGNSVWCWGDNSLLQLSVALSLPEPKYPRPLRVPSAWQWKSVSAGDDHACAIRNDGTLWCWGGDNFGQLGPTYRVPVTSASLTQVGLDNKWIAVNAGKYTTCGIQEIEGAPLFTKMFCWGLNSSGQLGLGTTAASSYVEPQLIGEEYDSWNLVRSSQHTCALRMTFPMVGKMWCWGRGDRGQLGLGPDDVGNISSPAAVAADSNWKFVAVGLLFTCGIQMDDTLWCWGANDYGQTGVDSGDEKIFVPTQAK